MASENGRPLITRRDLCWGVGGAVALLALGGAKVAGAKPVVRPPGGQDEERVLSACIRCEKCYEICPHRVIAPAHIEDGLVGMRSPVMDFDRDYCTFCDEENGGRPLCVQVCPTGALKLDDGATARNTFIGLARITEEQCLAFRATRCRICVDACPYEALELDENAQPYVIEDRCNGCGACESVCISHKSGASRSGFERRAIYVDVRADAGTDLSRGGERS
ncbi:MAG: 4Fe-4S dicluster domain-containing protein [Coriobacteriia bacterium]|nr:4Fe-4S dicluster domain-containing protein [Coriobacteriia bacterium]MBS5477590.1 4Fe-4S dicluster domain-containing protein [Coriobacteriia bacterium]